MARLLPPGARVVRASEQADTVAQLTAAFELNLTALSLLALVVGMFLVYNTVLFSVVQRRAVFGTLRTLGTTPGQLFRLILAETLLTAALGAALGVGLGYLLGQSAVRLVTRTINDLYYVVSVSGAPLTLATALKGVAMGLGAALVAALAPALEAARVEPVTALRPSTFETRARRLVPGLAPSAWRWLCSARRASPSPRARSLASFAGLFGVVLGIALMAPAFTVGLMTLVRPAASRLLGPVGRLATGTVARAVSRTGVAAAALMVAVSVTIGVSVMIASFRSTVANWLELTLQADVYVSAPSPGGARSASPLSADVPALVAAVPGVAEVETVRLVHVPSPLGEVRLAVTDGDARAERVTLPIQRRQPAGNLGARPRRRRPRERALRVPARDPAPRRIGRAAVGPRPGRVPGGRDLLRLRQRAGHGDDGARGVRAALGRSRAQLRRRVRGPGPRSGRRDRRGASRARGPRAAGGREPGPAPRGAADLRPHLRGDRGAARAGRGRGLHRRVERAARAAGRAHPGARYARWPSACCRASSGA